MDDSRERKAALDALSKYEEMIVEKCKDDPTDILGALSELKVITEDEMDEATDNDEYGGIMSKFKAQVKKNPNIFLEFCQKVGNSEDFVKLLTEFYNKVVAGDSPGDEHFEVIQTPQQVQPEVAADTKILTEKFKKLRNQLQTLKDIPVDSKEGFASKQAMIQNAVKSYISTTLDLGVPAQSIQDSVEELYGKYYLLEKETCEMCHDELRKQNRIRNPEDVPSSTREGQKLNEIYFSQKHIQNSLVACHMLEEQSEEQTFPHTLCEVNISKALIIQLENKGHRRIETAHNSVSSSAHVSQASIKERMSSNLAESNFAVMTPAVVEPAAQDALMHHYLIAKHEEKSGSQQHCVYYIAFSSHQNLAEWKNGYSTFQEGFEKQWRHIPLRFILEKLWGGNSVVLTGFSFGGILAHLCASHLWSQSQEICPELLERNLLCITYGQPLILFPEMERVADRIAENRFHAINSVNDIVPRLMRYLDTSYSVWASMEMPEKFFHIQFQDKVEIFQDEVTTAIMNSLIPLQTCDEKFTKTQMMRHKLRRKLNEGNLKLQAARSGVKQAMRGGMPQRMPFSMNLGQGFKPRYEPQSATVSQSSAAVFVTGKPDVLDALADFKLLIIPPRRKIKQISSYVCCHKIGARGTVECKDIDLRFPENDDLQADLFSKHNTESYLQQVHYQGKQTTQLKESNFTKPNVKKVEIHHFSHRETSSISFDGERLCFTSCIELNMKYSDSQPTEIYDFQIDDQKSVTSESIQLQNQHITVPPELCSSYSKDDDTEYQELCGSASIILQTHFGDFIFPDVPVKHKKFTVSRRKQQMAKLSPTEIIELCFLSALLERQPEGSASASKRYEVICDFFEKIKTVIPVESAFSCIANTDNNEAICRLCHTLKSANLKLPFSLNLFVNTALAITKLQGGRLSVAKDDQSLNLEDLFYVFTVAARKRGATMHQMKSVSARLIRREVCPFTEVEGSYMTDYLKWFAPSISTSSPNHDLVSYLQSMMASAIDESKGQITAISGVSVKVLFDSIKDDPKYAPVVPPMRLLQKSRHWLQELQSETRKELVTKEESETAGRPSTTEAYNSRLLDYVNSLRNGDLYICIRILLSFMEERVRIPITENNSKISYWKLLKLGLGIFRRKISSGIESYISVGKHVQSIADEVSCDVEALQKKDLSSVETDRLKYAAKLQFLLSASLQKDDGMLIDNEYPIYSMEKQLYQTCSSRSIDDTTPHDEIWKEWDNLFQDVAMGTVVESHRRLVAMWLKFSLMIHRIRSELACHSTVGIVGLVNSGKSTLVHQLFKIKVETGTREDKRTTVPFLYNIQDVKNFDVIDFPGVDDQDESISDLVDLLRSISQLVVFVVNYRNAHTQAAVQWYKKLNDHAIPHLVCLTHGDRLYAECREEQEEREDPSYAKRTIKQQTDIIKKKIVDKVSDSPVRTLDIYSIRVDPDSDLNNTDGQQIISEAGIKGVKDVGRWIVSTLDDHLGEKEIAKKLKEHFSL